MSKALTIKCNRCNRWFVKMAGFCNHHRKKHRDLSPGYSHAVRPDDTLTDNKLRSESASESESSSEEDHKDVVDSESGHLPEEIAANFAILPYQNALEDVEFFNTNQHSIDEDVNMVNAIDRPPEASTPTSSMTSTPSSGYTRTYHP